MNEPNQPARPGLIRRLLDARVIQTLAIYIPVAWIFTEILTAATPQFGLPPWLPGLAMVVLISGVPVVAFLAWAFQVTPDGIRTEVRSTKGGMVIAIAAAALLGTGTLLFRGLQPPQAEVAGPEQYGGVDTRAVTSVSVFDFASPADDELGRLFAAEISDRLAKHADLYVTAADSLQRAQLAGVDLAFRQDLLLTDHRVEGTIEAEGDSYRLNARLVDPDGRVTWEDDFTFGQGLDSQSGLQRRVARRLAELLGTRAPSAEYCEPTSDIEALEAYHSARLLLNERGPEKLAESERLLKLAIERDPEYGRAYSALAINTLLQRKQQGLAGDLARKALDLCPTLGAAYLIWVPHYEGVTNWAIGKELQWQDALAMEPNHLWMLDNYAGWLEGMGRMDEASAVAERAYRNNPLDPRAVVGFGWTTSYAGNWERAQQLAERALELGDKSCNAQMLLLHVATNGGGSAEDILTAYDNVPQRCKDAMLSIWSDYSVSDMADDFANANSDPAARRRVLDFMASKLEEDPNTVMVWGIQLSDPELAHRAFGLAIENGSYIHRVAFWTPTEGARQFRRDPRFSAAMKEFEMDDYWREFGWPSGGMCAPLGEGFVCDN